MILSPIDAGDLPDRLDVFGRALDGSPRARRVFDRIAGTVRLGVGDPARWHRDAVGVAAGLGMRPIDGLPQDSFSWDGSRVRVRCEAPVLTHEVAHYQIASPLRRSLPDFGLGAGPETGRIIDADAARCVSDAVREREEQRASLLGVLWDTALGHAGIEAFLEQNWLEGAGRAGTAGFFAAVLDDLHGLDLIDEDGTPRWCLRSTAD